MAVAPVQHALALKIIRWFAWPAPASEVPRGRRGFCERRRSPLPLTLELEVVSSGRGSRGSSRAGATPRGLLVSPLAPCSGAMLVVAPAKQGLFVAVMPCRAGTVPPSILSLLPTIHRLRLGDVQAKQRDQVPLLARCRHIG